MIKHLLTSVIILSFAVHVCAATDITTPTVSGHWTIAGSPYRIFNNISIASTTTLTIDPGVEVVFQGGYTITVAEDGYLAATGSAAAPITFRVEDTTGWSNKSIPAGGWGGIIFSGLTSPIAPAHPAISYCNFTDMKWGCINVQKRSVSFKNCDFYHNHSTYGMGIISVSSAASYLFEMDECNIVNNSPDTNCFIVYMAHASRATATFNKCTFSSNEGYCALFCINSDLLMKNCNVHDNKQTAHAGLIGTLTLYNSNVVLKGNKIYRNTSFECGAVVCNNCNADINGNSICNNQSLTGHTGGAACMAVQGGGGIRVSSDDTALHCSYTVRDNVLANNYAALSGGAVYVYMTSARIYNNTIVHNTSGDSPLGGTDCAGIAIHCPAMIIGGNNVQIKNNLFYGNEGSGIDNHYNVRSIYADTIEYEYNWTNNPFYQDFLYQGIAPLPYLNDSTKNIIGTNPGMVNPTATTSILDDAAYRNFALTSASPCIDKGHMTGISIDSFDAAGNQRVHNAIVDMGAYEYAPGATTGTPILPQQGAVMGVYPNPATTTVFISTLSANGTIMLQNTTGSLIAERAVTNTLTSFDIHTLPRGLYFATWEHDGVRDTQKVIVQ